MTSWDDVIVCDVMATMTFCSKISGSTRLEVVISLLRQYMTEPNNQISGNLHFLSEM